jgi:hypothetical protein
MNNNFIKLLNLLYLSCIYVIIGIIIGSLLERLFNKLYGNMNDNIEIYNKKSTAMLIIEIITQMFIIAITFYYIKQILLNIPMFNIILNNIDTAKNYDLIILFSFSVFSFQQNIENKYIYLINRLNKYNIKISKY